VQGTANEGQGRFSPSQQWVAYASDETGRFEVYLRPFEGPGERVPVSSGGGQQPRWSLDGKRVFYLAPNADLMAVDVREAQTTVTLGAPRRLFRMQVPPLTSSRDTALFGRAYAVGRGRFLVNQLDEDAGRLSLTVRTNWPAAVQR
jgi:hypothetical protein